MTDDHREIYLEASCCVDPDYGRQWNIRDLGPNEDCDEEAPWIKYVRADLYESLITEVQTLRESCTDLEARSARQFAENSRLTMMLDEYVRLDNAGKIPLEAALETKDGD